MHTREDHRVLLHYWNEVPFSHSQKKRRLLRTGHLAIEVKQGDASIAYLGWWPQTYTVIRENRSQPYWKKILEKLLLWLTNVKGKTSSYYRVEDLRSALSSKVATASSPDQVDAVLVGGKARGIRPEEWGPIDEWEKKEVPAQQTLWLKNSSAETVIQGIHRFREEVGTEETKYQFVVNNCATITARILRESGIRVSSPIWWPSLLLRKCLRFTQ